jgi:peptidylamidoglycolate lyase
MTRASLFALPVAVLALACLAYAQEGRPAAASGVPEYMAGPYEEVENWPIPLDPQYSWGRTPAIFAETPDRVFVMQSGLVPWTWKKSASREGGGTGLRAANEATHCAATTITNGSKHTRADEPTPCVAGQNPVVEKSGQPVPGARWEKILMIVDRNGKLVETWDQHIGLFTHPHSVLINPYDPDKHVWVIDDESEQIFKFTKDGKLVMTLGEFRVARSDATHFGGPTGIAWLPNGDMFISDGYHNARVVKYSKEGRYLSEWGRPGTAPGQFRLPHAIAIDAQGRVYVCDRSNNRVQVFDQTGKVLAVWPNIGMPNFIAITKDQHAIVVDGRNDKFLKYDLTGTLLSAWGTFGSGPGQIWGIHSFNVDNEGTLYTASVFGGKAQKFRPRKGADPSLLFGPFTTPGSLNLN